jgi:hypothetical protein
VRQLGLTSVPTQVPRPKLSKIKAYLTGMHPTGNASHERASDGRVSLIGVSLYLTGVHVMGIHSMGMHLIGVYLTGICLIGVYLIHSTGDTSCSPASIWLSGQPPLKFRD